MVKRRPALLDRTFAALAHPTRRRILDRLTRGPVSVTELAREHPVSLAAVSKHLDVLEEAGLLRRTKRGRVRQCELATAPMREASAWIARYRQFWEPRFDALARHLARKRMAT